MGIKGFELEELRGIFEDRRIILEVGLIDSVEVAVDRSLVRCRVKLLPEENMVIARMSWEAVGPDAGFFQIPEKDDLVIVGFVNKDHNEAFVIKRLTSRTDKIPLRASLLKHLVLAAKSGQETHIISDSKVILDKGGLVPGSEPLVLGNVLKDALTSMYDQQIDFLDKLITGPIGIGNLGNPVPTDPTLIINLTVIKTQLTLDKLVYITTTVTNIVSQLAFTER